MLFLKLFVFKEDGRSKSPQKSPVKTAAPLRVNFRKIKKGGLHTDREKSRNLTSVTLLRNFKSSPNTIFLQKKVVKMTEKQKCKIRKMRLDGLGYKAIASALALSLNSVKSYCRRNGLTGAGMVVALNNDVSVQLGLICKNCGAKLKHVVGKKQKVFCSDRCRKLYWKVKNEVNEND